MSADERKLSIINAAKPLFAANGFNGTSMRQIAAAAKVSGALLYKHFPSKEAMHKEILSYVGRISNIAEKEFKEMEPGTETLVLLVFFIYRAILLEVPGHGEQQKMHERLLFYSLLEHVSYAQMVFDKISINYFDIAQASYDAAVQDGDIIETNSDHSNLFWFVHHLAMSLNLCHLSPIPAFSYKMPKEKLIDDAILFALRGMGLTDNAIRKYYKPKKLKIYIKGLFFSNETDNA
ncbi:MAG: TetR/AcrR family transcriptional regulator [Deltaproteobacteria bacterium]|nr:TetR/AcrR family transcriptional regulator [Deltaproteobacteria bacterium]